LVGEPQANNAQSALIAVGRLRVRAATAPVQVEAIRRFARRLRFLPTESSRRGQGVFDNDINHIPMNSGFKGETRILHSDESGFQRLLEGRISLCRFIGHPLSVFADRNRRVIPAD
jgi:hypothetical protein